MKTHPCGRGLTSLHRHDSIVSTCFTVPRGCQVLGQHFTLNSHYIGKPLVHIDLYWMWTVACKSLVIYRMSIYCQWYKYGYKRLNDFSSPGNAVPFFLTVSGPQCSVVISLCGSVKRKRATSSPAPPVWEALDSHAEGPGDDVGKRAPRVYACAFQPFSLYWNFILHRNKVAVVRLFITKPFYFINLILVPL